MSNIAIEYTHECAIMNFKAIVSNRMNLPAEEVEELLARYVDFQCFIPQQLLLESLTSSDNPYLPTYGDTDDTAYHDLLSIEEVSQPVNYELDIWDIIKSAEKFDEIKLMKKAKKILEGDLNSLENMITHHEYLRNE